MKNLSIWQRLNLAMAVLIFLLGVGGVLAFWMESAQVRAASNTQARNLAHTGLVL